MYVLYFYVVGCVCQSQINEHVMLCYGNVYYSVNIQCKYTLVGIRYQGRDTLPHWAATSIRHCSQPPSVILWTSPSRRPLAGWSPSSWGLHYGLSWWLETEGWSPQTILAQNRGGWPAANESRTSDSKATRPGQIGMTATCGNGYVFDKLLKKKNTIIHTKGGLEKQTFTNVGRP